MPQHSAAVRHVVRRLIEQRFFASPNMFRSLRLLRCQRANPRAAHRPLSAATTTCFGSKPGRRPSVNAISISGTIVPRRLKTPIRNAGASGMRVTIGQSTTSSTSSTESKSARGRREKRSTAVRAAVPRKAIRFRGISPAARAAILRSLQRASARVDATRHRRTSSPR